MKKINLLVLTILFLGLFSCKNDNTVKTETTESTQSLALPMHVGEWSVVKMNIAGEEVLPSSLGNPVYIFNADDTYMIKLSGQTETGTYTLNKDKMVLTANNAETIHKLKLTALSSKNMTYEVGDEFKTVVSLEK